jgi:hypothetical protein
MQMIPLLPKLALIIADAGYVGYEVTRALIDAKVWFLIRMSCNATLFTEDGQTVETWTEGIVYFWPVRNRRRKDAPIRGRLIRVVSRERKHAVWLLTNIEDPNRLSVELASRLYRWRWESEGFFRTYKRTLKKLKLESRTIQVLHRELEASMLATQLLLCQGALAMPATVVGSKPIQCSLRRVLLAIRSEFAREQFRDDFSDRLSKACRDTRARTSAKERKLEFPGRRRYKPPEPPVILPLPDDLKPKLDRYFQAA